MTASNTISESDFLSLYAGQSPEVGAAASRVYLAAAEAGDKKLVLAHAPKRRGQESDGGREGGGFVL